MEGLNNKVCRELMFKSWNLTVILVGVGLIACSEATTPLPEPEPEPESEVCEQSECWDSQYYVCRDQRYNQFFTRTFEWTGGDATYSVELPNDKRLWMFGDTFIDQVNSDGSRPSFRLINNSMVIEEGDDFSTYYSGSRSNPESFASPVEENWWYWPADGTVAEDTLYLFMHGFGNDTGGAWDFYRTSVDLVKLDPNTLIEYENVRLFDVPVISWGAAILEEENFTYVYGVKSEFFSKKAYVARTNATLNQEWEYYTGHSWSTLETDASPIFSSVSEQFSVFKKNDRYYMLTQNSAFGYEIYLYDLSSPYSIPSNKKTIYCTPESGGDIFTYNALAHPSIHPDSLMISYNINSFDYTDLLDDVNNYRPYFVRVGSWENQ